MDIIFATQNEHKVREINKALHGSPYRIIAMGDIGYREEIPETGMTLEENALIKARYLREKLNAKIMAEDTGLEIVALDNEPGIFTARYAGPSKNPEDNMNLVLKNLGDRVDRSAQFRAVIALIEGDQEYLFEGIVKGHISRIMRGTGGFGYDPIFIPQGYKQTFAEMGERLKIQISHRARAIDKMVKHLLLQS